MVETMPTGRKGSAFDGIQCLRFVAALMVVLTHSTFYASERLTPGSYVWGRGTMGVDIFFVISGFVMYVSSIQLEGQVGGWKAFATKRLVRIVPLYWLLTSVKLAILIAVPAAVLHAEIDWIYIAQSYFFIPASNVDGNVEPLLGVGWTLIFEMFFYLLFTVSLLLRMRVLPFVSVILALCALGSLFRGPEWPAAAIFLDMRVLEFLAGMLIAKYFAQSVRPLWLAVSCVAAGFLLIFFAPSAGPGLGRLVTLVLPASLVVFGVISLEPHFRGRFPVWMTFMGAASYSLYLVHPIVAPAAPATMAKLGVTIGWLSILGSLGVALVCAVGVYLAFEKPVTGLFGRLLQRRDPPVAPRADRQPN